MPTVNIEIDFDDLSLDDIDFHSALIREVEHEFKLAVRRAIKADQKFEEKVRQVVRNVSSEFERQMLESLS